MKKYKDDDKLLNFLTDNYGTLSDILNPRDLSSRKYLNLLKQNTKLTIGDSTKFTSIEEKNTNKKSSSDSKQSHNQEHKSGFWSKIKARLHRR
jgi:hypothetical protein